MGFLKKLFKKNKESETVEKKGGKEASAGAVTGKEVGKIASGAKGRVITGILRAPHITEKTSSASKENKFVFAVSPRANKIEVKKAVEFRYGVKVVGVNILNMSGKERRRGRQIGWKSGFKKAVVTIKKGQSIDIQ